jgi:hypothetical protein
MPTRAAPSRRATISKQTGLKRRMRPLPDVCENELPPLPRDLERVVHTRRVMLLDANSRILDSFDLDK